MIISAQVFDGIYGRPAVGLRARLARADGTGWVTVADAETNDDGHVGDWETRNLGRGLYRILFNSETYFAVLGSVAAYPEVAVTFRVESESAASQVQVHLTLSPCSYSTYYGTTSTRPGHAGGPPGGLAAGRPLPRTERIAGAERILAACPDWSDRVIAQITGLSAKTVAALRKRSAASAPAPNAPVGGAAAGGKRLGRDGKRRPVVPAEARRRAAEYVRAHPGASVREVARAIDVSVGTVHGAMEKLRRGQPDGAHSSRRPTGRAQAPRVPAPPVPVPALRDPGIAGRPRIRHVIYGRLSADPALRYSERGRVFLRWIAEYSLRAEEWRGFIDAIPGHRLDDVSQIAAGVSEEWQEFAEQLARKVRNAS